MEFFQYIHPTRVGVALAAISVVAGAPLFTEGLRALKSRRRFGRLRTGALGELPTGFVHVQGRVALESPLFAPLSAVPCAGYRLDVRAIGAPVERSIDVLRSFRLVDGGVAAHVGTQFGHWEVGVSEDREITADQPLTEGLTALLAQVPEAVWWRQAGGTLRLIERALRAESECHVVGHARAVGSREGVVEAEAEWRRTGTDGAAFAVVPDFRPDTPALWIGATEPSDFVLVSDRAPAAALTHVPLVHTIGVVLGPLLSLAGLLYLAGAAEALRAIARL